MRDGFLKILSDDDIYQVHLAALRILREVGLKIREPQAVSLLKEAGCLIDGDRVRFPSHLVEEAVAQAPSTFTIYGRDPEFKVVMEGTRVHIEPMIGRLNILDLETGQRRRTTLEDVANLIKLADALENYSVLHSGAIMPHIEGIPDAVAHVNGYLTSVRNSSKIIKGSCRGKKVAQDCIRMATVLAGGEANLARKPNIFTTANIISPLEYDNNMTPFIINLDTRPGVRFLPVEGPEVDKLLQDPSMIGWTKGVLKKGAYDGLTEDVPTLAITTTLICNADLPDDVVYKITKAIYESGFEKEVFEASEKKGFPKACDLNAVPANATIPVHPGAKKYFEEKGIKLP